VRQAQTELRDAGQSFRSSGDRTDGRGPDVPDHGHNERCRLGSHLSGRQVMAGTPAEKLAEPALEDPMNDKFEFLITANELSPTYWACTWSKNVLGVDPVEWFAQKISGDWEALQKAGKAVENLAGYSSSFSDEIEKAAKAVDTTWD